MKKFLIIFYIFVFCGISCFAITSEDWQSEINKDFQEDISRQNVLNKQNVFLYFEIFDSLCRKYGYKYIVHQFKEKIPAKIIVKSKTSSFDYEQMFRQYESDIAKGNYSSISSKLADLNNNNIEAQIEPERTETGYYTEFKTGISDKKLLKEAKDIYKKKMYSTKPQPYSVVGEIKKYKDLKKDDMRFICNQFEKRINSTEILPDINERKYINNYNNDCYWDVSAKIFKTNAEKLDKKYAAYYPQNLHSLIYEWGNQYEKEIIYFIF